MESVNNIKMNWTVIFFLDRRPPLEKYIPPIIEDLRQWTETETIKGWYMPITNPDLIQQIISTTRLQQPAESLNALYIMIEGNKAIWENMGEILFQDGLKQHYTEDLYLLSIILDGRYTRTDGPFSTIFPQLGKQGTWIPLEL